MILLENAFKVNVNVINVLNCEFRINAIKVLVRWHVKKNNC